MKLTNEKIKHIIIEELDNILQEEMLEENMFDSQTGQSLSPKGDQILAKRGEMIESMSNIADRMEEINLAIMYFGEKHIEKEEFKKMTREARQAVLGLSNILSNGFGAQFIKNFKK